MERGNDVWQLAHQHADSFLRRFGDRWTRNHRDDLVQETAMAAWRWARSARDPARFWAAVRTIARRVRYRALANACRERTVHRDLETANARLPGVGRRDRYYSIAGRRIPAHRVLPSMRQAIARLQPLDRQLLLGALEGFCCAELSVRSDRSEQCVKTRLHRARRRVQREVEESVRAADGFDT